MWRRTYLLLLVLRIYFALSPSYLHPDEVFQGPEVISGSHQQCDVLRIAFADASQALSSHILSIGRGSGPQNIPFAVSFPYGYFTGCRCPC